MIHGYKVVSESPHPDWEVLSGQDQQPAGPDCASWRYGHCWPAEGTGGSKTNPQKHTHPGSLSACEWPTAEWGEATPPQPEGLELKLMTPRPPLIQTQGWGYLVLLKGNKQQDFFVTKTSRTERRQNWETAIIIILSLSYLHWGKADEAAQLQSWLQPGGAQREVGRTSPGQEMGGYGFCPEKALWPGWGPDWGGNPWQWWKGQRQGSRGWRM